jgi:hypothetical protein
MTNEANNWILPLAGAVAAVVLFTALSIFGRRRGLKFLDRWAREQGYTLVSARRRSLVPHWRWTSAKGYQFFRVTVRDPHGRTRRSWIRCSDFAFTDPNSFEVIWDDEPQQPNVA